MLLITRLKQIFIPLKSILNLFKKLIANYQFSKIYKADKKLFFEKAKAAGTDYSQQIVKELPINEKNNFLEFDKHYLYHTAWAARCLKEINPIKHIDISSMHYFATISSAFVPIEYYDYRPLNVSLSQFKSAAQNLYKLTFNDNSIQSLSCMHTVEHIGLGRYGDEINPQGDVLAINELKRVVAPNGNLLFVVPIAGVQQLVFNAHRVYTFDNVMKHFEGFTLNQFALISDKSEHREIIVSPDANILNSQQYGCGCFWFIKK